MAHGRPILLGQYDSSPPSHTPYPLTPPTACEDADRKVAHLVALYGTVLLNMIDFLIEKNEFHNRSTVKNLGLILALFIQFAVDTALRSPITARPIGRA